jgi:hypothetical protein
MDPGSAQGDSMELVHMPRLLGQDHKEAEFMKGKEGKDRNAVYVISNEVYKDIKGGDA